MTSSRTSGLRATAEMSPPRATSGFARQAKGLPPDRFVSAFAKGLSVIRAFDPRGPMTIAELAKASGLDRAGARRILLTLETLGYVRTDGKRFWLTPSILSLGYRYLASLPFWHIAQPVMDELVSELHETCSIGVLDGDSVMFILRVPTRRYLSFDPGIGSRVPAYLHSMGRVLLAELPDSQLAAYLSRVELRPYTRHTIASVGELERAVVADREQGWSFVSEQYEEGMCGIAVAIPGVQGVAGAALNISLNAGPQAYEVATGSILPKLRLAARRLSGQARQQGTPQL